MFFATGFVSLKWGSKSLADEKRRDFGQAVSLIRIVAAILFPIAAVTHRDLIPILTGEGRAVAFIIAIAAIHYPN
jgi:hypothetical protein